MKDYVLLLFGQFEAKENNTNMGRNPYFTSVSVVYLYTCGNIGNTIKRRAEKRLTLKRLTIKRRAEKRRTLEKRRNY